LDFTKIKNLCSAKDRIKASLKTFVKHIQQRPVSKIYKELFFSVVLEVEFRASVEEYW
jgi:hypothetical protein